jgi:glycerate-2-kinase
MATTRPAPDLRRSAEEIWTAAIEAVEPGKLVGRAVGREGNLLHVQGRTYDLDSFDRVLLAAFGKAAPAMARSFLGIAGDRVRDGVVVALPGQGGPIPGMKVFEAPHPSPDVRSLEAAGAVLDLARSAAARDLFILLLSGGGSAMVCAPAAGVRLEDKSAVAAGLIRQGADIFELNTVRKHLSAVKGGHLARAASRATVLTLAVSDVLGDDPSTIASGPTSADGTTFADALGVLERYCLWDDAPPSVRKAILEGLAGGRPETPKPGDAVLARVTFSIIGNNATAMAAARARAESRGFRTVLLAAADRGEARDVARRYAGVLAAAASSGRAGRPPLCFLAGGELTVTVRGRGRGGRNQEFVLAALEALTARTLPPGVDWLAASLGTDGIDGNSDAAGAWAGPGTIARASALGLRPAEFLAENDSSRFFEETGGLIRTGPTGTNVCDVRVLLLAGPDAS